jgi:hypothetical protein
VNTPQTKTGRLGHFLVAFLAVMIVAGIALADFVSVGYRTTRGVAPATTTDQSAISAVQTKNWTATPINPVATNGNPRIAAFLTFSSSGATSAVECGLYHKDTSGVYTFLGISKSQTITASTTDLKGTDLAGGRYVGTTVGDFDTFGANYYDMRVNTISAGSVTVIHYPFGAGPRPGE